MKFQIILESVGGYSRRALMPDDEFEKLVKKSLKMPGFKLLGARSLDGVRAEFWQPVRKEKDILE